MATRRSLIDSMPKSSFDFEKFITGEPTPPATNTTAKTAQDVTKKSPQARKQKTRPKPVAEAPEVQSRDRVKLTTTVLPIWMRRLREESFHRRMHNLPTDSIQEIVEEAFEMWFENNALTK